MNIMLQSKCKKKNVIKKETKKLYINLYGFKEKLIKIIIDKKKKKTS